MTLRALTGSERAQLEAARLAAVVAQPFLASVLFTVVPVAAPELGTFAVDRRWRLYVDPEALATWGPSSAGAVLLHETAHLVRDHAARADQVGVCSTSDAVRWNLAADAAINDDLVRDGLDLPSPVLPADFGLLDGGTEEQYYRQLVDRAPSGQAECGSGAHGRARPWEAGPVTAPVPAGADRDRARLEVVDAIRREPGRVPGGWRRWAAPSPPLVGGSSWRSRLRQRLAAHLGPGSAATVPSWRRPNRRHDDPIVLRPGRHHVESQVAVIVDTSASVQATELEAAMAEVAALVDLAEAVATVVVCDAEVHDTFRVRHRHELARIELVGGGGTDLRAAFDHVAAMHGLQVVVVFTDGWTPWPTASLGVPVLVVTTDRPGPTWAETVLLDAPG